MNLRLISSSVLLLTLGLPCSAPADLVLDTGDDLSVTAGQVSGPLSISATVSGTNSTIAGWQTSLRILPDGGTTGTLQFQSLSASSMNYALGTVGDGVTANFNGAMDEVLAFDFDGPAGGVTGVTHNVGTTIGISSLTFSASASALGTFGIYAIEEPSLARNGPNGRVQRPPPSNSPTCPGGLPQLPCHCDWARSRSQRFQSPASFSLDWHAYLRWAVTSSAAACGASACGSDRGKRTDGGHSEARQVKTMRSSWSTPCSGLKVGCRGRQDGDTHRRQDGDKTG